MKNLSDLIRKERVGAINTYNKNPDEYELDEKVVSTALHVMHPMLNEWVLRDLKAPLGLEVLNSAILTGNFLVIEHVIASLTKEQLPSQLNKHTYNCALLRAHPKIIRQVRELGVDQSSTHNLEQTLDYMQQQYGDIEIFAEAKKVQIIKPFQIATRIVPPHFRM